MYEDTVFYTHGSPCFWWFKSPDDFEPLFPACESQHLGAEATPCYHVVSLESGSESQKIRKNDQFPYHISSGSWISIRSFKRAGDHQIKRDSTGLNVSKGWVPGHGERGKRKILRKVLQNTKALANRTKKHSTNRPLVYDLQFFPLIKVCLRMFFYPWDTRQADKTSVSENRVYHNTPK